MSNRAGRMVGKGGIGCSQSPLKGRHLLTLKMRHFLALKGRHIIAQGEALGT